MRLLKVSDRTLLIATRSPVAPRQEGRYVSDSRIHSTYLSRVTYGFPVAERQGYVAVIATLCVCRHSFAGLKTRGLVAAIAKRSSLAGITTAKREALFSSQVVLVAEMIAERCWPSHQERPIFTSIDHDV